MLLVKLSFARLFVSFLKFTMKMEKSEKLKKGSEVVALRMRVKGHGDEVFDLMKIPVEVLYREALCEIGEQKSYIEELEATVKQLKKEINERKNASLLDKSERVAIAKEVKKEELYNNLRQMMKSYREEIKAC